MFKASALPVLSRAALLVTLVITKTKHLSSTLTLADAVPTYTPESSCSQSHWRQHKTTDEDKTLLTTPSSTLRAQSGPFLVLPLCVSSHMEFSFSLLLFFFISSSFPPSDFLTTLHPCLAFPFLSAAFF